MKLLDERREGWYHVMDNDRPARLVIIFWGANDAAQNGLQAIPLSEYKERLSMQVSNVRKAGGKLNNGDEYTNVILVTPPPLDDVAWKKAIVDRFKRMNESYTQEDIDSLQLDRDNQTTKLFADAAKEVGKEVNCPVVDLYYEMQAKPLPGKTFTSYFCDGLHFSRSGNDFMFNILRNTIKEHYPELIPEAIEKGKNNNL